MESLHRVLIDILCDRLAYVVADHDCAWVVHAAPEPAVISVRARLRDAGVHAGRLTGCRQSKGLFWPEVTEQNGRGGTVETGVHGRVFRMRRGGDEWQPGRIGNSDWIAVCVCERDGSHRPPSDFGWNGAIESLSAPDCQRRVGHGD